VYVKIQFLPDTEHNIFPLKKSFAECCMKKHSYNGRITQYTQIYRSLATTVLQHCHDSVTTQNLVIFQEKGLKVLKCYNFLWEQRRHNCSLAASFTNCVMTLYLLKVHLQTFRSIPITQKCQILSCDTLVVMSCMMLAWK